MQKNDDSVYTNANDVDDDDDTLDQQNVVSQMKTNKEPNKQDRLNKRFIISKRKETKTEPTKPDFVFFTKMLFNKIFCFRNFFAKVFFPSFDLATCSEGLEASGLFIFLNESEILMQKQKRKTTNE